MLHQLLLEYLRRLQGMYVRVTPYRNAGARTKYSTRTVLVLVLRWSRSLAWGVDAEVHVPRTSVK